MVILNAYNKHWIEFLMAMTEKEIKARYKFAVLGFLWIILNPLLQMIIVGVVFQFLIKVPTENYFVYLFAGLLVWNFFSYTVTKNTPMILNERSLIKKATFPRESIILSIVLSNAFHFLIAIIFFLCIALILVGTQVIFRIPILLIAILLILLITAGLSLLFSALNVRYRDMNFFVQALMPLWFYATPIVYASSLVPKSLHIILYLNPLTVSVELFQYVFSYSPVSSPLALMPGIIISFALFFIGLYVFHKQAPSFEDWV